MAAILNEIKLHTFTFLDNYFSFLGDLVKMRLVPRKNIDQHCIFSVNYKCGTFTVKLLLVIRISFCFILVYADNISVMAVIATCSRVKRTVQFV